MTSGQQTGRDTQRRAPMLWALLAKLITRQPPLFQAVVLGLCVGLFVTAGAQTNTRDTVVEKAVLQTAVAGG